MRIIPFRSAKDPAPPSAAQGLSQKDLERIEDLEKAVKALSSDFHALQSSLGPLQSKTQEVDRLEDLFVKLEQRLNGLEACTVMPFARLPEVQTAAQASTPPAIEAETEGSSPQTVEIEQPVPSVAVVDAEASPTLRDINTEMNEKGLLEKMWKYLNERPAV
jgi:hypothetical protein